LCFIPISPKHFAPFSLHFPPICRNANLRARSQLMARVVPPSPHALESKGKSPPCSLFPSLSGTRLLTQDNFWNLARTFLLPPAVSEKKRDPLSPSQVFLFKRKLHVPTGPRSPLRPSPVPLKRGECTPPHFRSPPPPSLGRIPAVLCISAKSSFLITDLSSRK